VEAGRLGGEGVIGPTSRPLRLTGLQPEDEILTILARQRLLSPLWDIHVVVQRWPPDALGEPLLRMYRGYIDPTSEVLKLAPGYVDAQAKEGWAPMKHDVTAAWLLRHPLVAHSGLDLEAWPPRPPPPYESFEAWRGAAEQARQNAPRRLLWTGETLFWTTGANWLRWERTGRLQLESEVEALAFVPSGPDPAAGEGTLVLALGDRTLRGYRVRRTLDCTSVDAPQWIHPLPARPAALAAYRGDDGRLVALLGLRNWSLLRLTEGSQEVRSGLGRGSEGVASEQTAPEGPIAEVRGATAGALTTGWPLATLSSAPGFEARRVELLEGGWLAIVGRHGVRLLRPGRPGRTAPDAHYYLAHETAWRLASPREPRGQGLALRRATQLRHHGSRMAVIGARGGRLLTLQAPMKDGEATLPLGEYAGPEGHEVSALVQLKGVAPSQHQPGKLLVLWTRGRRTLIEVVVAQGHGADLQMSRQAIFDLEGVRIPTTAVAARMDGQSHLVLVADGPDIRAYRIEDTPPLRCTSIWSQHLDSMVMHLELVDMPEGGRQLTACTSRGTVWGLQVKDETGATGILWTYYLSPVIRGLRMAASQAAGPEGVVVLTSEPDRLTILDGKGRLKWEGQLRQPVRMPHLWEEDGLRLAIPCQSGVVLEVPRSETNATGDLGIGLGGPEAGGLDASESPWSMDLPTGSDLEALATRCLAQPLLPAAEEGALREAARSALASASPPEREVHGPRIVAAVFRRLALAGADRDRVQSKLTWLSREAKGARWACIEAARAWVGSASRTLDDVLGTIDQVPPEVVLQFEFLPQLASSGAVAARLAQLLQRGLEPEPDLQALEALATGPRSPGAGLPDFVRALGVFMLAHVRKDAPQQDRQRTIRELVACAHGVERRSGLLARLASAIASRANKTVPTLDFPIDDQIRWLQEANDELQLTQLPASMDNEWHEFGFRLTRWINEAWRESIRSWLKEVQSLVRPRVRMRTLERTSAGRVQLLLEVLPESRYRLEHVAVEVRCEDERFREIAPGSLASGFERRIFERGEPAERIVLGAISDASIESLTAIPIKVKITSGNHPTDERIWALTPEKFMAVRDTSTSPFATHLRNALMQVVEQIRSDRHRFILVAGDSALAPEELRRELSRGNREAEIDLDGALHRDSSGPARARVLSPKSILQVIAGRSPLEPLPANYVLPSGAASLLVVHSCAETLAWLLAPSQRRSLESVFSTLRASSGSTRITFIAPADLLAELRRRVPDSVFVNPASSPALGHEETIEAIERWVAEALGPQHREAVRVCRACGWDMRVLSEVVDGHLAHENATAIRRRVSEVAGQDLRALDASSALQLFVLVGARTPLEPRDLKEAMLAAEGWSTNPRRATNAPKTFAQEGQYLTALTIDRIRKDDDQRRHSGAGAGRISVVGAGTRWSFEPNPLSAGLARVQPLDRAVLERLVDDGFALMVGDVFRAAPVYERAISDALANERFAGAAFRALTGLAVHDALEPSDLAGIDDDTLEHMLGPARPTAHGLRVAGKIWRSGGQEHDIVEFARGLTDTSATPLAQGDGSLAEALCLAFPPGSAWVLGLGARDAKGAFAEHLVFAERSLEVDVGRLGAVQNAVEKSRSGRVIILGPGVAKHEDVLGRHDLLVLESPQVMEVLVSPSRRRALNQVLRVRAGLSKLSPFVSSGPLPPGSDMFVGRREILDEVGAHIRQRSYLLAGARQMGKTSLLNRLWVDLGRREDLRVYMLEGQGRRRGEQFAYPIQRLFPAVQPPASADPLAMLDELSARAQSEGRMAVFLLNEVDGLLETDDPLVAGFRGLHDSGAARFVLVSSVMALAALQDARGPLYHMTSGLAGDRAINLSELREADAQALLDKLEGPPLELTWFSDKEREAGRALLIERTYCVPWVIQERCGALVTRLDQSGRTTIRLDDVRFVTDDEPLLAGFENLDVSRAVDEAHRPAANSIARMALDAAAQALYFRPGTVRDSPTLQAIDPETLSFTSTRVLELLRDLVHSLLPPREADQLWKRVERFPFERVLLAHCLTVVLATYRREKDVERHYYFPQHLYPRVLYSHYTRTGETPEDRCIGHLSTLEARWKR
jgi:hypothetical protein